jgi:hypothetical protein
MPSAETILRATTDLATTHWRFAVLWHALMLALFVALMLGHRPRRRAAAMLVVPLLSVSCFAWSAGNTFNGGVFAVLSAVLLAVAWGLDDVPIALERGAAAWAGAGLALFGFIYPHFLPGAHWFTYLYASPLGVVPCPTLSALIGLTLLAGGFGSRALSWIIAAVGLYYGLVGWLVLGVSIDAALVAGALALAVLGVAVGRRARGPSTWSDGKGTVRPAL